MKTQHIYLQNPDVHEISASILKTGFNDKGSYVVLDRTIFYPQGGGQPADQGIIESGNRTYHVHDVRKNGDEIHHYIDEECPSSLSHDAVNISIDSTRRKINTCYHSAGHLIASVVENMTGNLKAVKGHQFPGEAYVEFLGEIVNKEGFMKNVNSSISHHIDKRTVIETKELEPTDISLFIQDFPYHMLNNKSLRVCHIHGFTPVPCGGTHVKILSDLRKVNISKVKNKKGKIKISYKLIGI